MDDLWYNLLERIGVEAMQKTLVLGSTVLDMIVRVEHLPNQKEDVHTKSMQMSLGGMAYNVYYTMQAMKSQAILGTPIGTGFFADCVKNLLNQKGMRCFAQVEEEDNGCCLCLVDQSGERTFISHHGAEYRFDPHWFDDFDFNPIDRIYLSGLEVEEPTGLALVEFVEKKGIPLLFAPGPRLMKIEAQRMERLLQLHPMLHLNDQEAQQYTGRTTVAEAAQCLYAKTQAPLIITCGEAGAWLQKTQKEGILIPSKKVVVQDTIGAGDSHAGAFLAALQMGKSLQEAVVLANRIAEEVVQCTGGLLHPEQAMKIKREQGQ